MRNCWQHSRALKANLKSLFMNAYLQIKNTRNACDCLRRLAHKHFGKVLDKQENIICQLVNCQLNRNSGKFSGTKLNK